MNRKLLSIILAAGVAVFFLFEVLASPSGLNFLPFLIHESMIKGGQGEAEFIKAFDIIFSIFLFYVCYKILYKVLK